LFVTASGARTELDTSEPIGATLDETQTGMLEQDRFAKKFLRYQANDCTNAQCLPVTIETYDWNGSAFVVADYAAKHQAYVRGLGAQRACLKQKFDPNKAAAACGLDYPCETNNDLSFLSYQAGQRARARDYAASAMEYCRGAVKDSAAALYTYRRSLH
jgi:hypothetical protein